ncbi:MAG: alpha/beta fold hydrolase [Gammaproteobacteria bacterium]|nr:alpha/beta fold hydrolase [Gammaproteobacteria bacterium]
MGGAVAMQMALDRPGRVPRLVLSNTLPSFQPDTLAKRWLMWTRLLLMNASGPRRLSTRVALKLFPKPSQAELRERVARRRAQNDKSAYVATIRAIARWSVRERLAELTMPVLVLAAEHDYMPGDQIEAFAETLPNARYVCFPDTRHGLPLEAPEAYNRVVLDFLLGAAQAVQ